MHNKTNISIFIKNKYFNINNKNEKIKIKKFSDNKNLIL
jgi:hypothetical protein